MPFYHNPCGGHLCLLEGKQDLGFPYEGIILLLKFLVSFTLKASCEQYYGFSKMTLYIKWNTYLNLGL